MSVKDYLLEVLKRKTSVITRAAFWKISHNDSEDQVNLKIGRYAIPREHYGKELPETLIPKSELTLDDEELQKLVLFLQKNYEPFRQGVKAFIPLEDPYQQDSAEQIKALFSLPDRDAIIDFIVKNEIISDDLYAGLIASSRVKAVKEFRIMLATPQAESKWQEWFKNNSWVLGSEFVRILDDRAIDTQHISDFLMEAYDGFLDIVEIKKPEGGQEFWAKTKDHGNLVPSTDLIKAITQASRYIYEVEREANSVKFLKRVNNVKTIKPRCVLIFGRSDSWGAEENESYRILNCSFHNLSILTYDHVLERAKRIAGIDC